MTLRRLQAEVFAVTFSGYASFHLVRRALSIIKPDLVRFRYYGGSAEHTTHALAIMDTLFLAFYAGGLFLAGPIGDRVNRRVALFICSWLTSVTSLLFALLGLLHVTSPWPYVAVWGLSGLVQSGGWPLSVAIVGHWFPARERGTVLGIWSANAAVGNIAGAVTVAAVLQYLEHGYQAWMAAMVVVALPLLGSGLVTFFFLKDDPAAAGYPSLDRGPDWMPEPTSPTAPGLHAPPELVEGYGSTTDSGSAGSGTLEDEAMERAALLPPGAAGKGGAPAVNVNAADGSDDDGDPDSIGEPPSSPGDGLPWVGKPTAGRFRAATAPRVLGPASSINRPAAVERAIGFRAAWLIPGVPTYAACYGCVKMVGYALMNWLALLIAKRFDASASLAGSLSSLIDLGMIAGGIASGYASDAFFGGRRALVSFAMLLMTAASLLALVNATAWSLPWLTLAVGFWLGGPSTLVNGAVAADLGTDPKLKGSTRALSTVVGIIDGVGSVGAAIGQAVVGVVAAEPNSWSNVIVLIVAVSTVAALLLARRSFAELQELRAGP